MGSGQDDTAAGVLAYNGYFSRGCACQTDIDHIEAHGAEGGDHKTLDHLARQTGVASHNDYVGGLRGGLADQGGVSGRELYNINGAETLTGLSADSAADTGNGFDK